MITFEQAYEIVSNSAYTLKTEEIYFTESLNRIIAEDVLSDIDMPPFNKSAVDGIACLRDDFNNKRELVIKELIQAGKNPECEIFAGECAKIMTGAMLPEGADCVIMIEDTIITDNKVSFSSDYSGNNICYKSEDIKQNEVVLKKDTLIKPQHIAVLASVGVTSIKVYQLPRVGIISTGDELVEPEVKPVNSQIRNSNAWQLYAQVKEANGIPKYIGIAADNKEATRVLIKSAFESNDIVLLTGGVSMGDFDFVPEIMKELKVKILFKSIAVQPGRPTVFGKLGKKFIFGLPGNPVSSFVQFEMLVKPLIYKLQNRKIEQKHLLLLMGKEITRKKVERKSFLPVQIIEGKLYPIDYHGSAHIHAYVFADGIIALEQGVSELKKGDLVNVRQL